jgi:broad specificity phosphatase PhoE
MTYDSLAEIWLVRHGQSESNANLTTSAPHASRLTEKGWQEARILAGFIEKRPDLIVVSPYARSLESALPLREKYPDTPLEQWPIEEFTYLPPLSYRGTTATQRLPIINDYWQKNDPDLCHPGAESFTHFLLRVHAVIERLRGLTGLTVVISHGHTMRLLWLILATGLAASRARQMQTYNYLRQAVAIPNCAMLKLRFISEIETLMSGFIDVVGMQPER